MKKGLLGGVAIASLILGSLLVGSLSAEASRVFKPVTRLRCNACHRSAEEEKMSLRDLTGCGVKSYDMLKKAGYKPTGDVAEQREWAQKVLKGFKC